MLEKISFKISQTSVRDSPKVTLENYLRSNWKLNNIHINTPLPNYTSISSVCTEQLQLKTV